MSDLSIIRHQAIFDVTKNNPPIHIIGAGATGSRLWLSLVELGLTNISVYDFDHVEAHNLANQIYFKEDIGKPKVFALAHYYQRKTGHKPPAGFNFVNTKIEAKDEHSFPGIVFLLTDTMASRKEIFYGCILDKETFLMIETRMASSYGDVNVVNPFDPQQCDRWVNSLVDDDAETTEVSACGSSISVGPTASIIANMAVWQMILFLTDPAAMDPVTNIHLKPLMLTLEK
jgi:molybdopterin/thiamine biosynthesis adenylyltransferase